MATVGEPLRGVKPLYGDVTAVAQFDVPLRGTLQSSAAHKVPADAVYNSVNVFLREGKLRERPGLSLLNSTVFAEPVTLAAMAVTPLEKRIVALTANNFYELGEDDVAWVHKGAVTLASSNRATLDMAFLETSGEYVGLIASEGFALKKWDYVFGVQGITAAPGTITPFAKSVCIAARRVITLVPPHTIAWSKTFDYTNFPVLAQYKIAQTNDVGVAVRSLSNLSFCVYKERSIYTARAQSGNDEIAFAFAEPIEVEGPAGVRAVVRVLGSHVYMTKNGRIALFEGSRYPQWIADGLWLFLQGDIDPAYAYLIFGVFDYRLHTVTFFYPRKGEGGRLHGMVIICFPYSGIDVQQGSALGPASFKGVSSIPCSTACEMRFNRSIDRSLLFSNVDGDHQSFIFDEEVRDDDQQVYTCMFQTGLQAMPNARHAQVTVETFVERGFLYGTLALECVTSNGLENTAGTTLDGNERYLILEDDPVRDYKAFNVPTRFVGLKYTWESDNRVRWSGAIVHGRGLA